MFSGIKSEIETINNGEEMFYEENYSKIGVNTDNNVLLNKKLKLPTLIIIVRCVFEESGKLYPQICLDECFYDS